MSPRWTAQNRPLIDTSKPATTGVAAETNGVLLRRRLGAQVGLDFGPPAARSAFEHVRMMEQPIEERGDGGGVAQQLPPIVDRSVGRQERRRPLVATDDDFKEIFSGGVRQFPHA